MQGLRTGLEGTGEDRHGGEGAIGYRAVGNTTKGEAGRQANFIASSGKFADFLDTGNGVNLLHLDCGKVCGTVPRGKRFVKLEKTGISRRTEREVNDCLKERQQEIVLKGEVLGGLLVSSGIPYGSIWALILFQLGP